MITGKRIVEGLTSRKRAGRQADSREEMHGKPPAELSQRVSLKLRSERGETLTETLCAVLIAALAAGLLAVMSGTASRMNSRAIERDNALYEGLAAAESKSDGVRLPVSGNVTVKIKSAASPERTVIFDSSDPFAPVIFYGEEGMLASYRLEVVK